MRNNLILAIIALFSVANACIAQQRGSELIPDSVASTGRVYAIIIGISDYKNIRDLKFADRDAESFYYLLSSRTGGNVPDSNIFVFLNSDASKNRVANGLSNIASRLVPGDRFIFFFAGHGDMEVRAQKENGLLLLHNSPDGNYFGIIDDVLEVSQLRDYLTPLSQKGVEILYIIDACHSGKLSGGTEGAKQTAAAMLATWGKEQKMLSCQPNQLSLEGEQWGGGRGLFSLKLEEALNGKGDLNKDGQISMLEMYIYTLTEVSRASSNSQIPLINGDLTKPMIAVTAASSSSTNGSKTSERNRKSSLDTNALIANLNAEARRNYLAFDTLFHQGKYLFPKNESAFQKYKVFEKSKAGHPLTTLMKQQLLDSLPSRFNRIVTPLLTGGISYSTRSECYLAAEELDSCLSLLGPKHYLYSNYLARKLYMQAMGITWALSESEYNSTMIPNVDRAISLLEESYELEPNAAYTSVALGERYFFVSNFKEAEAHFKMFLDLRPKDLYGKLSLGKLYMKMGDPVKAEKLFREVSAVYPDYWEYIQLISDALLAQNKKKEALREIYRMPTPYYLNSTLGLYYSKTLNLDSAIYYYGKVKEMWPECNFCNNNVGHLYLVNDKLDLAASYFRKDIDELKIYSLPNFNLGTIETLKQNFNRSLEYFDLCIKNSDPNDICYILHSDKYFNKSYIVADSGLFKQFVERIYIYNVHYIAYLSGMYAYLRDSRLKNNTKQIDAIFQYLFTFKEFEAQTYYHYACWRALEKDMTGALNSLEKALEGGFGGYFQLISDQDLAYIQSNSKYKDLMAKYFPEQTKEVKRTK